VKEKEKGIVFVALSSSSTCVECLAAGRKRRGQPSFERQKKGKEEDEG